MQGVVYWGNAVLVNKAWDGVIDWGGWCDFLVTMG